MSEPTKHPPQTIRDAYKSGYDAACRDNKRKREESYGYRLERAYFGADATTPQNREGE